MSLRGFVSSQMKKMERGFETLNLIEIDSGRILENFDVYTKIASGMDIFPVLKANAYGHGIGEVTSILKKREFPYVVVDGYFEGLRVWEVSDQRVLLIGYVDPVNYRFMNLKRCAVAVWDRETVQALGKLKKTVKIHVKVDTGMNRQGVQVHELRGLMKEIMKFSHLDVEGVMSHFADADGESQGFTQKQKELFNDAVTIVNTSVGHEVRYVHIGATAGGAKLDGVVSNAVRLGIGLYGYNLLPASDSVHEKLMKLQPALTFKTKLAAVKKIKKGDHVSYNCTYTAPRDMTIGVLPMGYYEGIDRRLSNKAVVMYKGTEAPILGRVCMNLTVIGLPNTGAKRLDDVEVISADTTKKNSVVAMAKLCKTIPYDILVHLNERVRRVVV